MVDMSGVYALLVGFLIMAISGVAWFQFVRWQHARRTQATVVAASREFGPITEAWVTST